MNNREKVIQDIGRIALMVVWVISVMLGLPVWQVAVVMLTSLIIYTATIMLVVCWPALKARYWRNGN